MSAVDRAFKFLSVLLITILLLFSATGKAAQQELKMVGEAKLEMLFWSVYHSRLYTEDGRYQEGRWPVMLEIEYLMDIDSEELVSATEEEWRHLGLNHPKQQEWLSQLLSKWPDVRENDRLAMLVTEQGHSQFLLNQKPLGTIDDADFSHSFLSIWLSPNTSRPALRTALLGGKQ